jgi:hypothetical protein
MLGILGAWWAYKRYFQSKPAPPKPIPKFPESTKEALLNYFENNPTASVELDKEWRDALRLVPTEYKLNMLDRCTTNATTLSRGKAIVCAFYKLARVWVADPSSYPLSNLLNLMTLFWAAQSDGKKLTKRTDLMAYNAAKQEVSIKEAQFKQEMQTRIRYILDNGYAIPTSVQNALARSDAEPFVVPVDVFLYAMLETFVKFVPTDKADCAVCA